MAPDQGSSSSQVLKPLDNLSDDEDSKDPKSPLKNVDSMNGCIAKGNKVEDSVPDIDPCKLVRLDWFQVHRVGAGLANLGNSCFLNTVIQCLTYCPPLANYLLQNDHCSSCQSFEFCMMCELQKHIKEALDRSGDVIKPVHIYENLKFIAEHFQSGQQEDAHEFLRFVIENLWRASLYNYSNEHVDSTIPETTVINYIFGGYNRSQVVCLRCKKRSNTYEHFMDFILDIKHNANSLEKALEHYVKPEILDKENAYNCPQCNTLVPAEKTYSIHRAPNVATIQLKRFDYNKTHGGKITKHVSYPEQLDLRPFMSEKTDHPLWYKLNAVLVHVGQNCNSGHYFCYIRNSNGHWYLMDDARVQRVSLSDVLNQQAYLLFYVRVPISNEIVNKKELSCMSGSDLKIERSSTIKRVSSADCRSDATRNHKVYMPFAKWATCRKNAWNSYRKSNNQQGPDHPYGTSSRESSHSSSSSSYEEKSSHEIWDSNSVRSKARNLDLTSKHCGNTNKNSFRFKRFRGEAVENHDLLKGRIAQTVHQFSPDSFYSKNGMSKNFNSSWKSNFRWHANDNRRNEGRNYCRSYSKQSQQATYRSFSRSASDTNLYLDNDYYNQTLDNYGDAKYSWKQTKELGDGHCHKNGSWQLHAHKGQCRSEIPYNQEFYHDDSRWRNRNGFRYSQQYSFYNKQRYVYEKDGSNYRKFHEKSRSADSFSRPRFYPYYIPRRQTHLQECF